MTIRWRPWLAGVTVAALLFGAPAAFAQEEPPEPELTTNLAGAGFGERVIVSGSDWPPNTIVQVEICGNAALNGTSDCDQITAIQAGVSTVGTFAAVMLVGNPPTPCPCVFRVSSFSSTLLETIDFELRGAAVSPDEPAGVVLPERRLAITDARLKGSGPWTALFGARPNRTLTFTVVNIGFVAVNDPSVVLAVGKGDDPTGFVAPPSIGRLEPGESVTVSVDVELPVFAIGTYAVEGSIPGFDAPVEFRAESSHVPWLLVLLPVLILAQVALIAVRNRLRRRVEKSVADLAAPPESETEGIGPDEPDVPPAVIDLREDEPDDDDDVKELASIIGEELDTVFEDALAHSNDDDLSDEAFVALVVELSKRAGERVASRTLLTVDEREGLDDQIAEEMLAAFGVEREAAGSP